MYIRAGDVSCERVRCDSCQIFGGNCGGCITVKTAGAFNLESFHAMLPVDEADVYTVCVTDSFDTTIDPIYADWDTMQGATPFDSSGKTYSTIKIAQGYWCASPEECPISARLKSL